MRIASVFIPCALLAICTVSTEAHAQFITTDRTIANGNPFNENVYTLQIGRNSAAELVPNVHADLVAGTNVQFFAIATSNSIVNMYDGRIGFDVGAAGSGLSVGEQSQVFIRGGSLRGMAVLDQSQVVVSGGIIGNGLTSSGTPVQLDRGGTLTITGGTIEARDTAVSCDSGSSLTVSGGTITSSLGAGIGVGRTNSRLIMTGGTVTGNGVERAKGVSAQNLTTASIISGGTINGGLIADQAGGGTAALSVVQANISGNVLINGGIFATGKASVGIYGGTVNPFGTGAMSASFVSLGDGTLDFYGTGITVSGPTAGTFFDAGTYTGNYYTFTGGTLRGGQNLVGQRLFDATGNGASGGFTIVNATASAPEPSALALVALPLVGAIVRRRFIVKGN